MTELILAPRTFSIKKWKNLSLQQQHNKCAERLRARAGEYRQLEEWLGLPPIDLSDFEAIADRYHTHCRLADVQWQEHNLLIREGDRQEGAPYLPIAIYLDEIRSAHNVGSVVRTVEAFRLGKLYLSSNTPSLDHKQVQDASMGAWQWVEWEKVDDLSQLPRPIIALETSDTATPMRDFCPLPSCTLVLGNEERGCSRRILEVADQIVEIPLVGRKNSLNVANAFAILAHFVRDKVGAAW
jgi:tRNA G18 (ribose-2'-O)-methylase SpoU